MNMKGKKAGEAADDEDDGEDALVAGLL